MAKITHWTRTHWTRKRLLAAAEAAGCLIDTSFGRYEIIGPDASVNIWSDGSISRSDVDLGITKRMRVKDAAKALGLE